MSIALGLHGHPWPRKASVGDELTPQGLKLLEARPLSTGSTILRYQAEGVA